ncbi:GNAT family N-acetyltransferase [Ktedonosporobacter rubrisoli]|uniref:GNAT family N-acetyltransferase n=1 Tax=Ktedonosporobacter rubrisoli TaxID=2509675 RepID=A0A4V0YYK8_KTERU|nr:GNAT family N-acetyltransferase [Ktedonosporobacter rubrisoli]QBD76571.1 GNAT family N-acetyltransferase [Ktedonosporobacter rubrisoli]
MYVLSSTASLAEIRRAMEENLEVAYMRLGRGLGARFTVDEKSTHFFSGLDAPFANGVFRLHLREEEADERINYILQASRQERVPTIWLLGPSSTPGDLEQRLQRYGLREDERAPAMRVDLAQSREQVVVLPEGFSIQTVQDATMMQSWLQTFVAGFGFPEPAAKIFLALGERYGFVPSEDVRYYLGLQNGEPVSTSLLFYAGGMAGVYGVATVPQKRRQGLGAALTLHAMKAAREEGFVYATLQATEMGVSVYRRLGWQEDGSFVTYVSSAEQGTA